MSNLIKCGMAINLAVIILQTCVLGFQINRWNEIVGAVYSIVIALLGYAPSTFGESGGTPWFVCLYGVLLASDLVFQLTNMVLLICFQWVVIQYCIYMNVSVDISYYGGAACNEWWHFGYGEINYRDRALIVTILMAVVVVLRLVHVVINFAAHKSQPSKPAVFMRGGLVENRF